MKTLFEMILEVIRIIGILVVSMINLIVIICMNLIILQPLESLLFVLVNGGSFADNYIEKAKKMFIDLFDLFKGLKES